MTLNLKFWVSMTVFQVVFGLAVFTITRHYYNYEPANVSADSTVRSQPSLASPDGITETNPAQINASTFDAINIQDPVEISRQAYEFFDSRQYDRAADLYQRLLVLDPNNVDTYNNLGLTLHYLGRSTEALGKLNEGVAVDATYQRIWLTLGFVNSQLGNSEQARAALTTAVKMGSDNAVGQSAVKMLENLP